VQTVTIERSTDRLLYLAYTIFLNTLELHNIISALVSGVHSQELINADFWQGNPKPQGYPNICINNDNGEYKCEYV
jgi:hypothetical protein